jgi:hypothetical protein
MVTHPEGDAPLVVTAVMSESSSSLFSLSFLTRLWMALLENVSDSPPWRWCIRELTIEAHASDELASAVADDELGDLQWVSIILSVTLFTRSD